jgi:HEAT repeat protein
MREDREGFRSSQLDLFAWRERDGNSAATVDHGGRLRDALEPNRTGPENVAAITPEALHSALDSRFDDPTGKSRDLVPLIAEVERRREATAAPFLVRVCRRHAGFDRSRAVPEVVAALNALTAVGAVDAAPAIIRLVEQGALGHVSVAAALRYFASVRHRPAAVLLRPHLDHDEAEVREAACTLAAVIGTRSHIERLLELCKDTSAEVIDAALIALGQLGHRPVKKALESRLQTATIDEIPKIVDALVPVSDEETAISLGRLVERVSDENVRYVVAEALAELDGRAAVAWLLRLVDDPCPAIRQVVADALAVRNDPRKVAALRRLSTDADTRVGETARIALLPSCR